MAIKFGLRFTSVFGSVFVCFEKGFTCKLSVISMDAKCVGSVHNINISAAGDCNVICYRVAKCVRMDLHFDTF